MISVGMNYHVIKGKQKQFAEKFTGVIDALTADDGHTESTLWKHPVDSVSYLITSEWSDEAAFTARLMKQREPIHCPGTRCLSAQVDLEKHHALKHENRRRI